MKRRLYIPALIVVFFLGLLHSLSAQQANVRSNVNINEIKIGEQFKLTVTATQDDKTSISWPAIKESIGEKFEVIDWKQPDTTFSEDKSKITFTQEYVLTSFDSGYQVIPAFEFYYRKGSDTLSLYTDSIPILVQTVEVDTTKSFYDITSPVDAPFNFREILPYVIVIAAAVIAGIGIYVLIFFLIIRKRRKAPEEKPEPEKPAVPAHLIARQRFKELEEKRLWQGGKVKEYYSEVTDIIREYIDNRYTIDASEMTTDEIMSGIRLTDATQESQNKLGQLLRLADLVKFAKAKPNETDHEFAWRNANEFVEDTKLETPQPGEDSKP